MAIKRPIVGEIAYKTWCIDEFGMDAMFLLEGEERALLIDTGTGVFDIPALVKSLTDKPLTVALTHGHPDHCGGMCQFDEVFLNPADHAMARSVTFEGKKDYVRTMMSMSEGVYDLSPEDLIRGDRKAELKPIHGGMAIDLGKREVLLYDTPGHTPGGISFLDVRNRILFSGDACNQNTLLALGDYDVPGKIREKSEVSTLLKTAELLESLHPFYDRHYNGHIGYAANVEMMPLPECLVRDCIQLCKDLLSGKVKGVPAAKGSFGGDCLVARNNTMQIQYRPEQVC